MKRERGLPHADPFEEETRLVQKLALWALLFNLCLTTLKGGLAIYWGSRAVPAAAIDLWWGAMPAGGAKGF
jgi:divalent metal cation (Fe/Co/Zn/Cd) transporter